MKEEKKKKVESLNPFYKGASPEDVARALIKPRPKTKKGKGKQTD